MVNQITFTRFIAAFLIVFFHFGHLPTENTVVKSFIGHLNLGVSYFYVLSGFVMMLAYSNYQRINPKDYFVNRIARIYPLHILALVLTILVGVMISINYLEHCKLDLKTLLFQVLLVQAWIPEYSLSLNVPAWSISVEMFFYFLFPFLFNSVIKKIKPIYLFGFVLLFWLMCQIGFNLYYFSDSYGDERLDRYFLNHNPFFHLNSFLVGIAGGLFYTSKGKYMQKNYDLLIVFIFALICSLIFIFRDYFLHNGFMAIPFVMLILFLSMNTGFITKIFSSPTAIYLGEISFAVYLLQSPVYQLVRKILSVLNIDIPYLVFFTGLAVLLVLSHLTYKYFETPLRVKIKNLYSKKAKENNLLPVMSYYIVFIVISISIFYRSIKENNYLSSALFIFFLLWNLYVLFMIIGKNYLQKKRVDNT
ncbi:MAG: acyltransferase [Bergeyella sp.]